MLKAASRLSPTPWLHTSLKNLIREEVPSFWETEPLFASLSCSLFLLCVAPQDMTLQSAHDVASVMHISTDCQIKSSSSYTSTFPTFFLMVYRSSRRRKAACGGLVAYGAEEEGDKGNAAFLSWSKFNILQQWPCVSLPLPVFFLHTSIFQSAAVGNSFGIYPFCGPHPFHFNSKVGCICSLKNKELQTLQNEEETEENKLWWRKVSSDRENWK